MVNEQLKWAKEMKKLGFIVFRLIVLVVLSSVPTLAYFEDYPPYKSKEGAPEHLKAEALVDYDKPEFKQGKIEVHLKDTADTLDFLVKDGGIVLAKMSERETPLPWAVYKVDLDKNGLEDFIVLYNYRGNGLAASADRIDIFLKENDKKYQKISYDTMSAGLEDFVDLNKDGKYEVVITGYYNGPKHNYFTYSIYEIKDYKLSNADAKFKGFPKFVWMTDKPNDKDTSHLTVEERKKHVDEKNKSVSYLTNN